MKTLVSIALMVASLTFTPTAKADGYIRMGAMYLSGGNGFGSITSKTTRTLLDFGGGWLHKDGWTLGALYGTEAATSMGSPTTTRTSFGPTIGWMKSGDQGPYILGTYFMNSTVSSYKGTGYQLDLGYKLSAGKMGVGLQLSYKRFKYTENGGASIDPAYDEEYVDPYFVAVVEI